MKSRLAEPLCCRAGLSTGATGYPGHARVNSTRVVEVWWREHRLQAATQPEARLLYQKVVE